MPWPCRTCGHENLVNMENLLSWPLADKFTTAQGFVCSKCGMREAILYTTASLEAAMRKLMRYPPGHKQFAYQLLKTVRKAEGIRVRGEAHGAFRNQNMAST